jgi:methoxymalonate biosynthesis acyl carrier protein
MLDETIAAPIRSFMSRSFEGRTVGNEDDIFALGFGNSLFALQLVAFIERQFDIEIGSEDLEMDNFRSIRAISQLVERKRAVAALAIFSRNTPASKRSCGPSSRGTSRLVPP